MPPMGELVRVVSHRFVAALVIVDGKCSEAAPILRRHCLGKSPDELRALFAAKGWAASVRPDPLG